MPEAVIVAAARTPIGRARKGSLVDARPDDLAAFAIDAALKQVPTCEYFPYEATLSRCWRDCRRPCRGRP